MNNKTNLIVVSLLIFVTIVIVILCSKKNENKIENFKNMNNIEYSKLPETVISIPKSDKQHELQGNLDQCKDECNKDDECVGFVREKGSEKASKVCNFVKVGNKENIIKNIVNCHNEYKEVSDDYLKRTKEKLVFPPDKYYDYDTYFKVDVPSIKKDNLLKCIDLSQKISFIHKKHPFSYIILDDNNNLRIVDEKNIVMNKDDSVNNYKFFGKDGVFEIVKGLNGSGVSFKSNKYGEDYYIVHKLTNENLTAELFEESLNFKQNATFNIDMVHSEELVQDMSEVRYVSLSQNKKDQKSYWRLNEITSKIVIVQDEGDKKDKKVDENLLFELVTPIIYNPVKENNNKNNEVLSPAPSVMVLEDLSEVPNKLSMEEELEQLELDIRKSQHTQNIQLMNMMLDVNKFKLHDLSMSNYLTKCVGNSSEEIDPSFINQELEQSNLDRDVDSNPICKADVEPPGIEMLSPSISFDNNNLNNNINNNQLGNNIL